MNISLKSGVTIGKLTPQGLLILVVVAGIYDDLGLPCVVTSGDDPGHMAGSKHPEGNALDFRTRGIVGAIVQKIPGLAKMALGRDFDVVFESKVDPETKEKVEHIHVEYDPRAPRVVVTA